VWPMHVGVPIGVPLPAPDAAQVRCRNVQRLRLHVPNLLVALAGFGFFLGILATMAWHFVEPQMGFHPEIGETFAEAGFGPGPRMHPGVDWLPTLVAFPHRDKRACRWALVVPRSAGVETHSRFVRIIRAHTHVCALCSNGGTSDRASARLLSSSAWRTVLRHGHEHWREWR
jgi:hypothetical protein